MPAIYQKVNNKAYFNSKINLIILKIQKDIFNKI